MSGGSLLFLTDLPAPYRLHLFRSLQQEAASREIDLQVFFMTRSVAWYHWKVDPTHFPFPGRVLRGLHPTAGQNAFHLNPAVAWEIRARRPDWMVVGGAWWMPSALLAMAATRVMDRRARVILWSEANRAATRHHTGWIAWARRFVWRRADAFAVPGRVARETITETCGSEPKFLELPNLVDETAYGSRVEALRQHRTDLRAQRGLRKEDRVLLWPARLHEQHKGILRFLRTVRPLLADDVKILVVGEGPDRAEIEAWVSENGAGRVRLLGHLRQEEMLELYAVSDALLLPSLADPNPLSVIEALWAGLPILLSDRCGNWPETVQEGKNGWVVDPESADCVRASFSALLSHTPGELRALGQASRIVAETSFGTTRCVRRFIDQLEHMRRASC